MAHSHRKDGGKPMTIVAGCCEYGRVENTTEQLQKIAAPHSMTWSARASSDCGTVRPSARSNTVRSLPLLEGLESARPTSSRRDSRRTRFHLTQAFLGGGLHGRLGA